MQSPFVDLESPVATGPSSFDTFIPFENALLDPSESEQSESFQLYEPITYETVTGIQIDVEKAKRANAKYEQQLWGGQKKSIIAYFSSIKIAEPTDEKSFALAVAKWQSTVFTNKKSIDGVLGPVSWGLLKPVIPGILITKPEPSRWHKHIPGTVPCPAEPLLHGKETFPAMAKAIDNATGFIYILGWMIDHEVQLRPGDKDSTLGKLLENASNRGVEIRILVWDNPVSIENISNSIESINKLKNALLLKDNVTFGSPVLRYAINRVKHLASNAPPILNTWGKWREFVDIINVVKNEGSHHDKVMIVKTAKGLVGFCGGIDFNKNRILAKDKDISDVLHDVHCQVEGHAAWSLLQRFLLRWRVYRNHQTSVPPPTLMFRLKGEDEKPPAIDTNANNLAHVKIISTYNHPTDNKIKERSVRETLKTAIMNAEKSVHIECQYMISLEIADWLNLKIHKSGIKVSLLTQDDIHAKEMVFPKAFRLKFLEHLYKGLKQKDINDKIDVRMLHPYCPLLANHKLHSKIYIIDDELAIVGSANCSSRSMTHDSETAAVIFNDPGAKESFVNKLKTKLDKDPDKVSTTYYPNVNIADMDVAIMGAVNEFISSRSELVRNLALAKDVERKISELLKSMKPVVVDIIDPDADGTQPQQELETSYQTYPDGEVDHATEASPEQLMNELGVLLGETGYPNQQETNMYDQQENYSTLTDSEVAAVIENQVITNKSVPTQTSTCSGHICWAKDALNQLNGLSLPLSNQLDEASKKAIADFQSKNNLPVTQKIDAVTERCLLEAVALKRHAGTAMHSAAQKVIAEAKTRLEDWTKKAVNNKPQYILNQYRDPRKLFALVLHHMAFKRRSRTTKQFSDPASYLETGAHFCIMLDGRIVQLHPMSRMIWHSNCTSPLSVGVEFEGNFPNIKGGWWIDKTSTVQNKDHPTQAQFEAGRFLASYLKIVLGTTSVFAHRQSSKDRENDPGPDIWFNVGQWAIENLGMKDTTASKCGDGYTILPQWITWGNKTVTPVKEYYDNESANWETTEWEENNETIGYEADDHETGEENYSLGDFETDEEHDHEHEVFFLNEFGELIKDFSKTIRLNNYYANQLGWQLYYNEINDFLLPYSGQTGVSLGQEDFARAVEAWQMKNGYSGTEADGVIGPKTWAKIKPLILKTVPPPVTEPPRSNQTESQSQTQIQPSIASSGLPAKLGKLVIDTSVPALKKSFPEYQFTPEDALWLARFVEGEAGGKDTPENHAVIWAMFNRFGMLRHKVQKWKTFATFIRLYSTTLQPLLNSVGAAQRVWANYDKDNNKYDVVWSEEKYPGTNIKKVQYVKHIKLQSKPWQDFSATTQNLVVRILTGQIHNPGIGIATHFGSTWVYLKTARARKKITGEPTTEEWRQYTLNFARSKKWIWIGDRSNINQKGNAFFIQGYLKDVPADAVKIEFNGPTNELEFMDELDNYVFADPIMTESEEFLSEETEELTKDWSNAVRINRNYSNSLGWNQYQDKINDLLLPIAGMQNVSLAEDVFAQAVSDWQKLQGFNQKDSDGIIGPKTWALMKTFIITNNSTPNSPVYPSNAPSPLNVFEFNKWHAQKIVDSMNKGVIGQNFNSKDQLEKLARGEQVLQVNPQSKIIQILPIMSHIAEQAEMENFREIIFGRFF